MGNPYTQIQERNCEAFNQNSGIDIGRPPVNPERRSKPLNIIVPVGGIGSRFAKEGYRFPKPLINIVGRPMILRMIENLSLHPEDTLWMAINEDVDDEFRIGQLIAKSFPKVDIRVVRLRHQTRGASETLYIVTQGMDVNHLQRRSASLDCDTIYWADILESIREIPEEQGAVFYFPDGGDKPIYSYIKTDENAIVVDIQEKKAISNKANTGVYVFATAELLRTWAAKNIDATRSDAVGEYYTSQLIAAMMREGLPFVGIQLAKKDFSCVGTPEQLQELLRQVKNVGETRVKTRRFCFDLDMTLVGVPEIEGNYATCPPIWKNIELVQQLYKAGHHIIIQTARKMRTHHGNVGSILADVGVITFAQLTKYKIPFHDIHFGKPWADIYVDDLAVNANLDTMREIGWLLDEPDASSIIGNDPKKAKALGMIVARDFNTIQIIGDKVIKSSKSDNILGELYFYAHLPVQLLPIFPSVYSVDYIKETSNYTITMENRKGLTFSHLLVGRSITKGRLLSLLRALHTIHTTQNPIIRRLEITPDLDAKFDEHSLERAGGRVNIYANYAHKLRTRYRVHAKTYADLGPLSSELFNRLNEFLDTYEAEDKGVHAQIIHGDPVFSNAILSKDERKVSFIDVRCQLNNTLTMEGDIHYDLAKVLQSLVGYDHVLYRVEQQHTNLQAPDTPLLDEPDQNMLADLQEVFWDFLNTQYAVTIHRKTLLRITASLFFSLIPLHRPALSGIFLRMCKDTLDKAQEIGHGMGDSMLMGKLSLNEVSRPSTANSFRPGDLTEHSLMKTGGGILA